MITTEDFLNNTTPEEVLGVVEAFINRYNEDHREDKERVIIPDGQKIVYIKNILDSVKNCVWINPQGDIERATDKKILFNEDTARALLLMLDEGNSGALKEYLNARQIKELNDKKTELYP